MEKRRIALCGASSRGLEAYAKPLTQDIDIMKQNELIGIFDTNLGRAKYVSEQCGHVAVYETFSQMLHIGKPDMVIVATRDDVHVKYCIEALEFGVDVFCEKPMATTAEQIVELRKAEKRTGRRIKQCFNMRYYPSIVLLKRLVEDGVVGEIYNVHFEFLLTGNATTQDGHGASYFHRWNRSMQKSGGLLVTKATHHFDCVNWLVGGRPVSVAAFGELNKYGKSGPYRSKRCRECLHADDCEYYCDINVPALSGMYRDHEKYDAYYRDACVYDEEIDIFDTVSLIVQYDNGVMMSYSETAAAMYEGYKLSMNGSKGRIEAQMFICGGLNDGEQPEFIRHIDHNGHITKYEKPTVVAGSHDGADSTMLKVLLLNKQPEIPSQVADSTDGAWSVLIGVAGNTSIKEKRMVFIDEMIGNEII